MEWIKKNWLLCIMFLILVFWLIVSLKQCGISATDRAELKTSRATVKELEEDNTEKERKIADYLEMVKKAETVVAEKEKAIAARDVRIRELRRRKRVVPEIVEALEPPSVVLRTIELLGCDEIELREGNEVVFTLACAKKNLIFLNRGDLDRQELNEMTTSLTDALEALAFEKLANVNLTGAALQMAEKNQNLEFIIAEKDDQIRIYKKKRWVSGFLKGAVFGIIVTITVVVLTDLGDSPKNHPLW